MQIRNPNVSSTALKVLSVLDWIGTQDRPVSIAEIADQTGHDRPTVYRAALTLTESGHIQRDSESQRYHLADKVVSLARKRLATDDKLAPIQHALVEIVAETDETCSFGRLDGRQSVLLLREKGNQLVAVEFSIGDRGELHSHAIGKAILAWQPQGLIDQIAMGQMKAFTENTVTTADGLKAELAEIRKRGYALDDEEILIGMRCVAAPVFQKDGSVAGALSMSGPTQRYTYEKLEELSAVLRRHASRLSG